MPFTVKSPVWVLVMVKSGAVTVVASTLLDLSVTFTSLGRSATVAELLTLGYAAVPTLTVKVMTLLPPVLAIGPALVQVAVCPFAEQI